MEHQKYLRAVRVASIAAAMALSFATQRELAIAHGVDPRIAFAAPLAVDLYMTWAVMVGRDIALAVAMSVAANVASTLTGSPLGDIDTWVSAGIHTLWPLVIWRQHRVAAPADAVSGHEVATSPDMAADADSTSGHAEDTAGQYAVSRQGSEAADTETRSSETLSGQASEVVATVADSEADTSGQTSLADSEPEAKRPSVADIKAAMAVLADRHGKVTGQHVADHFGVSARTGRRYMAMAEPVKR